VDDNVYEREEVFVLVARILGQVADVACFQLDENSPCKSEGHIGGIRLRIRDNDGKYCITDYRFRHDTLGLTYLMLCMKCTKTIFVQDWTH